VAGKGKALRQGYVQELLPTRQNKQYREIFLAEAKFAAYSKEIPDHMNTWSEVGVIQAASPALDGQPGEGCAFLDRHGGSARGSQKVLLASMHVNSSCTPYQLSQRAEMLDYVAVIISVGSVDAYAHRRSGDPAENVGIPITIVASREGRVLYKYVEMSSWMDQPIARILNGNPNPEPSPSSRKLMTVTMAAPIFLFAILCISKLSHCGHQPVPRRERMRREAAAERTTALEDFVGGLSSFTYNKLPQHPQAAMLQDADMCTICLDGLADEAEVRKLPCECRYLYHAECIDPWLLANGNCPTCKHEFVQEERRPENRFEQLHILGAAAGGGGGSDTEEEEEEEEESSSSSSDDDSLVSLEGDDVSLLGRGNNSDNVYADDESSASEGEGSHLSGLSDSETEA